jgi:hypothetical protein
LLSCSPRFGSALTSSGSIGSSFAAAGCSAVAAAVCSVPAGRNTGFSSGFGRTSWIARIPDAIATIIAVSTEAMILFHSNADIDNLSPRPVRINYHAFGDRPNRACCRYPIGNEDLP